MAKQKNKGIRRRNFLRSAAAGAAALAATPTLPGKQPALNLSTPFSQAGENQATSSP
jgi:hypothetical protein